MLFNGAAVITLCVAAAYNWYFTYDYVLVNTDKGILRGFKSTGWKDQEYFTFKGIPYAKPPLGELRFKGPEAEIPWAGIRDALWHGSVCAHVDIATKFLRGEEDCLFLNVYTPCLGDERLPVMVWIHGGGFVTGSGNDDIYSPDYFMGSGIVLVTINYRLGALGFLSTEDDDAPGNVGLKDQVAALRWVKRNIANFGGDPKDVTIFGESAGGASTHYHILSPMSKGLFSKAIAQSGSALNLWAQSDNAKESTVLLAEAMGAKNLAGDTSRALEFLKAAPYEDVIDAADAFKSKMENGIHLKFVYTPSVERGVKSEEVFLPDSPQRILESGKYNKVPFITGYNSHEGYLLYKELEKPEMMNAAIEDTNRFVPHDIKNEELRKELAGSIRKLYFEDKPIANENITNLVDLYTDNNFVTGINSATKLQLNSSSTPIYFYVFSYSGGLNLLKFFFRLSGPGAAHGDELGYQFYHKLLFWRRPASGSEDEYVIETMIRLWTNFAKYGNPTPPGDPLTWEPARIGKLNYLNISGLDTNFGVDPDRKRADFWAMAYQRNSVLTR